MAKASLPELEDLIRTTGFFRNKAKSIQGAARKIIADFGGKVPQTLAELITIPGAARKTANVVLGVSFGKAEGVVVDTHVFRIARRLELAKGDTAEKVEQELMQVLPRDRWISFSHQVIHHGRQVCAGAQSQMQRVQSGDALPVEGQDVEFVKQRVSGVELGSAQIRRRPRSGRE